MINTTVSRSRAYALTTPTLARRTGKRENFARPFSSAAALRLSDVTAGSLNLYPESQKFRENERNRPAADGHAGDSRSRAAARADAQIARGGIPEKQLGGGLVETIRSEPWQPIGREKK